MVGFSRFRHPAEFLDRAKANSVGFPKRAVNGTSFGDPHFGSVDQRSDVGGVSIAVADKRLLAIYLEDARLEHPSISAGIRSKPINGSSDCRTSTSLSDSK